MKNPFVSDGRLKGSEKKKNDRNARNKFHLIIIPKRLLWPYKHYCHMPHYSFPYSDGHINLIKSIGREH